MRKRNNLKNRHSRWSWSFVGVYAYVYMHILFSLFLHSISISVYTRLYSFYPSSAHITKCINLSIAGSNELLCIPLYIYFCFMCTSLYVYKAKSICICLAVYFYFCWPFFLLFLCIPLYTIFFANLPAFLFLIRFYVYTNILLLYCYTKKISTFAGKRRRDRNTEMTAYVQITFRVLFFVKQNL